jgi:hypothetical protein
MEAPDILNAGTSLRKTVPHKNKESIMSRSVIVAVALLNLPAFVHAQETALNQETAHEVVRGETLWALAERYLGNPFRWPLIFEANRQSIQNPHLIFPGQVFVIPGLPGDPATVRHVTVVVEGEVRPAPPPGLPARMPAEATGVGTCPGPENRTVFFPGGQEQRGCPLPSPSPEDRTSFYVAPATAALDRSMDQPAEELDFRSVAVDEVSALYAVPFGLVYSAEWLLATEGEPESVGTVAGFAGPEEDAPSRDRARTFERVHVATDPGVRLQVGDLLQAFEEHRTLDGVGRILRPTGILTVTSMGGDVPVAMVSAEFHRLHLGSKVRRVPSYSPRSGVFPQPVESNLTGIVLGFPDKRPIRGFGANVFLDVGEDQGVSVGDEFGVYAHTHRHPPGAEVARLRVVRVEGPTTTARIVGLTDPVLSSGAPVRLIRKMW